jgi:penicillin amidase
MRHGRTKDLGATVDGAPRKRRRLRRVLRGLVIGLVVLVVLVLGGLIWLRGSLPQEEGRITVAGLAAPVTIRRDEDGIPTIKAQSETDAAFALGFAHAQDRLFQMEMMRRIGAGRLSEIAGARTVALDRRMRTLGLYRLAEASLGALDPDMRAALDAYSAGVNAFLATRSGALPPELVLMRDTPEPWRPADSLVWGRLMALILSGNWQAEALRARLAARLDPALLETLWPAGSAADHAGLPGAPPLHAWNDAGDDPLASLFGTAGASNSWVVDGEHSASGKPLLANDPHLGLQMPIQWYLARLDIADRSIAGATAPGVPMVVIGHNQLVAWTFTTTQGDTQDLFIERLAPGDPARYETPDGPQPFTVRHEVIKVSGGEDVAFDVRGTRHGVVVSDLDDPALKAPSPDEVLALAWPAFEEDDRTAQALYRLGHADTAADVLAALHDFHSPQQNVLFADISGTIGFVAAGRVPVRKSLAAGSQMPAPGWSGDYDWTGYLPFEELPQLLSPPSGLIATANNDIRPPDYRPFITERWEQPYRIERIEERLGEIDKHTVLSMASMQMDTMSLAARHLLPALLPLLPRNGSERVPLGDAARTLLEGWDDRMDRDAVEPLIYEAWIGRLAPRIFADELGDLYEEVWFWDAETLHRVLRDQPEGPADWCDDRTTPDRIEDCAFQVRQAFADALAALRQAYGDDLRQWRWGRAHRAVFANPVLGRIPLIGKLADSSIDTDGDNHTINRSSPLMGKDGATFPAIHGAGLRAIFDFADLDDSRFIIATGQSGNLFSPHYADMVRRWRDGSYVTLPGGAGGPQDHILTLAPQ